MKKTKYQKLKYISLEGIEITIYINKKSAYLDLNQIALLYGQSVDLINKIIYNIIKDVDSENQIKEFKNDDKIVLYNLKVIEEVGKVLKSRNGGCLSAFIKNHFKQSWEINSFEVLEIILEAITYL